MQLMVAHCVSHEPGRESECFNCEEVMFEETDVPPRSKHSATDVVCMESHMDPQKRAIFKFLMYQ